MSMGPSVLLATEGAYPYRRDGLAAWCHTLTNQLSEVNFTLFSITPHPYLAPQYRLAPNVHDAIMVPLSGTADPAEFGLHAHAVDYLQRRMQTTTKEIEEGYLPAYERLLKEIVNPVLPPRGLGLWLLRLHQHLRAYDYLRTETHPAVWEAFLNVVERAWRKSYSKEPPPTLAELVEARRLLSRMLLPLTIDIPRVDMAHSTAAGCAGLACVVQKLLWDTPYLLTEYRLSLRDQYLNVGRARTSFFARWFLARLTSTIVDINYAFANQVSPVCGYDSRWAAWRHVEPDRIRVIYKGGDPLKFSPTLSVGNRPPRPVVASVGAFDSLNAQDDLIEAAPLVRQTVPNVEFRLYGVADDEPYLQVCRDHVQAQDLASHVAFCGVTAEPWSAFREADVVVFPGVSDALPTPLLEAMLTGCAIVAADLGAVREALAASGILVPAKNPTALAEALAMLLRSPHERRAFGHQARQRALARFTEQRFVDAYRTSYARLLRRYPALPDVKPDDIVLDDDAPSERQIHAAADIAIV